VELGRAFAGSTRFPPRPNDGRDGVDKRKQVRRIVGIGSREADGKGNAFLVDDKVVFWAPLAAVRRV
jgi:hypothetical protein